jgi:GNAT superfamily N-acetyltransferase
VSIGIAVHPQFRAQGIGSALLQRGLEWAKETGTVRRMELTVYARNEGAIVCISVADLSKKAVTATLFAKVESI